MKKLLFSLLATLLTLSLYAQNDVTTFLGIPVDGFKSEMRQKLIAKGFTPKKVGNNEYLEGEFNGTDVHIFIATNNNKVYRIMVCDANTQDEANIKIRFNKLVNQFENNKRYTALDQYTISDTEDISYEMLVHKKNFDALFYQNPDMEKVDTLALQNKIREQLLEKYKPEQLENPTEEMNQEVQAIAMRIGMDMIFKKPVWFRICESYGEYYITMYYDNEYNHANGEDL
ncbi:MAG: hypothetical protein KIG84_06050 [Bacteroidales bacterium]|nr:hypothetical protein [Bacteroidales bacterium]